ncbi:pyroglutamyl-peptidase I [Microbaculum sp. FT89]|uniref:pyroglutamyl-peptidase I family protein n=1 Tax=Microbaculum sp. FT89 TaxID=3447298 RepID=UPI003F53513F
MAKPRLLVTGFSSFPGARRNPTEVLVNALDVKRLVRRFDIDVAAAILPTEYAAVSDLLPRLWNDVRPDAAIHFGLHGRARTVRIETRAANHATPVRPDAGGKRLAALAIEPGGPPYRRTTLPAEKIVVALRRAGIPATLSADAGGYLCNYATWVSLTAARGKTGGAGGPAGFVHLPWPAEERAPNAPSGRPGWGALALAMETVIATGAQAVRMRSQVRAG